MRLYIYITIIENRTRYNIFIRQNFHQKQIGPIYFYQFQRPFTFTQHWNVNSHDSREKEEIRSHSRRGATLLPRHSKPHWHYTLQLFIAIQAKHAEICARLQSLALYSSSPLTAAPHGRAAFLLLQRKIDTEFRKPARSSTIYVYTRLPGEVR